jgi:hypothetical protein
LLETGKGTGNTFHESFFYIRTAEGTRAGLDALGGGANFWIHFKNEVEGNPFLEKS